MLLFMEIQGKNHTYAIEEMESIRKDNLYLSEENKLLKLKIEALEKQVSLLTEQLRLLNLRLFGKKTEQQPEPDQIFDEDPDADTEDPDGATTTVTAHERKRRSVGRKIDTSKLPREQVIYELTAEEKTCSCGGMFKKFGEDTSEQLEYIPAQIKVIEYICSKYSCTYCESVKTASKPEMPMPKCMAAPSLVTAVIIQKFEHHLPWYRQSKIFAQDGIDIPDNTICNWFLQAGEILEPLSKVFNDQLNHSGLLQIDETPVKVLHKKTKAYMWCYHSCNPDNKFVLFEYNNSRSSKVLNDNLKNYQGIIQADGYAGYIALGKKPGVVSLICWAHCRRKFAEVVKISNKTGKAHEMVVLISELYKIESDARELKLDPSARKKLRQQKTPPILQKIRKLAKAITASSKSALGKAVFYLLDHWRALVMYVKYGEAEIDNNWVENKIRPFALGRKNWMFIGNERAGITAAFFYSILQTCRMHNIDARKYLIYILFQAGKMRRNEIDPRSLLPQFIDKKLLY